MLRTLDTTNLTLRTTLLIRSFFSSSSSSSFTFKTITTLSQSQSHYFLPLSSKLTQQQQHASFSTRHFRSNFGSSVIRCVSSFPTLDWNEVVSCSEVDADVDATHDDGTLDQDSKPAIPVRAFFFSTSSTEGVYWLLEGAL
ncbi:hypothetical protein TSUD_19290 [Trifolium subterraneum]|uniref:Uncharacterized protein n=1 Tax=Trifolium subterraneum TaxID=3900 RepID=A0A2Z6MFT1_TRISU|nr:hypothetical protein TSUD_19290 [Trifolium subterraneum]